MIYITKIKNDKYYTSPELAKYIVDKTKKIISEKNISEYIEPSAGGGVFLDYLDKPYKAYDIEPEDDRIIKQDYLTLDLEYKKGRCVIGNPPYGARNTMSVKFYKKSIQLGDYIAFILPISQLNNNMQMYEFDLIHSEDLGKKIKFQGLDKRVKLCFNIYSRAFNGRLNKKPNYKLKDVEIKESIKNKNPKRNKIIKQQDFNYDIRICAWGWSIGKEVNFEGQYAKEFCIKIKNNIYRNRILTLIKTANWKEIYPMTANENLLQWQVYKYLKEQIPELE